MDSQKIYEITFVGQDYQPIEDAVRPDRVIVKNENIEYVIDADGNILPKDDEHKQSDCEVCKRILLKMLTEIAPNGKCNKDMLIINSSLKSKNKLYDLNFKNAEKQGYFCGIVGVIRKQVTISLNDLKNEENEMEKIIFNVTLQIKSRLDVDEHNRIGKPYFLSTMLLRDKLELSDNMIPNNEDEIFDYLLLFWFKEQLQKACLKGYYKSYRRFEKNDDKIKGAINIAEHIKLNMGQKNGRIAYSYRENTINNYLNQLIVAAYYHLKTKYRDLVLDNFDNNIDLKNAIMFLSSETGFSGARSNFLLNKNVKQISHPFFTEYEQLRIICLRILRDEGISIFDGESEKETQGILFYLPELWEIFLEDEVIRKGLSKEITCKTQFEVKNFGYKQDDTEKYIFKQKTYPDYVFLCDNCPFMILDAKCKPKWEKIFKESSISGIETGMGDYNKCIRDMVATNSHATGVIFPTNIEVTDGDIKNNLKHPISEYNETDFFYTIPIQIPKVKENDTYTEWSEGFYHNIKSGIEIVKDVVLKENEFAKKSREIYESIKKFRRNLSL